MTLSVGARTLVSRLSLQLPAGQKLVLVGPNGSGKSTLLRTLAGLAEPHSGRILRPATPPGMLFQQGALWPHMSVEQHLEFVDAGNDREWCEHLLTAFDLEGLRTRKPEALSGGEQSRLALARALAGRPTWVLLDEPLAHLDPGIRATVREVLPRQLDQLGATTITVTHQADDALLFGEHLLCLTGDGGWWSGSTRLALESPPNAALAAYSERGTVLEATADEHGEVDFEVAGITLSGATPGARVQAYLDAASVRLSPDGEFDLEGRFVAPDLRGGSWVRVGERLLRSADGQGRLRAGERVGLQLVGQVRPLGPASRP